MDNSPASPLPGEMLYPSRSRTDIQRTGRRSARVARIDLSDRYAGTGELSVLSLISVRNASASPVIPPPFSLCPPLSSSQSDHYGSRSLEESLGISVVVAVLLSSLISPLQLLSFNCVLSRPISFSFLAIL